MKTEDIVKRLLETRRALGEFAVDAHFESDIRFIELSVTHIEEICKSWLEMKSALDEIASPVDISLHIKTLEVLGECARRNAIADKVLAALGGEK